VNETKWECLNSGGIWANFEVNFDSINEAFTTLFGMSATVGWADTMYRGINSHGIDHEPAIGHHYGASVFFISFIIIGSFFIMNLFVGVVISSFNH
jgi:voltage-dependent calcium channel T type alpha-1H